ncbi:MAG TPA: 5-(carboxyamino)imidazole ribonucleotide mutase [candidate division Zixibacteria bacterium]|nr:5-(carboxyamino)imidazole ribonucleotide mutase [candidate division Zixibacteria bacterium]
MSRVAIIAGSTSDGHLIEAVEQMLDTFEISRETEIISAHRQPDRLREFLDGAPERGVKVIIAIAGLAAHLPGVTASLTHLPVIGVPADGGPLNGIDALLSIVQMPGSTPVATMAIGKHGAKNAGIFAARILALHNPAIADKLEEYRKRLAQGGK